MFESLRMLYAIASGVSGSVGVMLLVVDGDWGDPPTTRQAVGCTLLIIGVCAALLLPLTGHRHDIKESFKVGFDAGYRRGRRTGRPNVVPLRQPKRGA